jgi:hypothetical protein
VRIPAIGLDSPVDQVSASASGGLLLPAEAGDAVLAGRLGEPVAVPLERLRELRAGDRIEVGTSDGRSLVFAVSVREAAGVPAAAGVDWNRSGRTRRGSAAPHRRAR